MSKNKRMSKSTGIKPTQVFMTMGGSLINLKQVSGIFRLPDNDAEKELYVDIHLINCDTGVPVMLSKKDYAALQKAFIDYTLANCNTSMPLMLSKKDYVALQKTFIEYKNFSNN